MTLKRIVLGIFIIWVISFLLIRCTQKEEVWSLLNVMGSSPRYAKEMLEKRYNWVSYEEDVLTANFVNHEEEIYDCVEFYESGFSIYMIVLRKHFEGEEEVTVFFNKQKAEQIKKYGRDGWEPKVEYSEGGFQCIFEAKEDLTIGMGVSYGEIVRNKWTFSLIYINSEDY